MNCTKCKVEMEEGSLVGDGGWWRGKGVTTSFKEMFGQKLMGALSVKAYRCPLCGKVEFITEKE